MLYLAHKVCVYMSILHVCVRVFPLVDVACFWLTCTLYYSSLMSITIFPAGTVTQGPEGWKLIQEECTSIMPQTASC